MPDMMPDDLWRDFPKTAPAFEARFKTEEGLSRLLDRGPLGLQAGVCKMRQHARLDDPERHNVRVRGLRASDLADVGHGAGEDAQAPENVVPRDL